MPVHHRNRRTPIMGMPTVTQAELAQLEKMKERHLKYEKLRNEIRNRVLGGAPVEPGRYVVTVDTTSERRLNHETAESFLGAACELLINGIPRTLKRNMRVEEVDVETFTYGPPQPVFDPADCDEQMDQARQPTVIDFHAFLTEQLAAEGQAPPFSRRRVPPRVVPLQPPTPWNPRQR